MKILVLSDTHHNLQKARNVLKKIGERINMVFHLGDMVEDAEVLKLEFDQIPFTIVAGNNDFGSDAPMHKMVTVNGCRILITHGHRQSVHWNYDTITYWAEEQMANIVLFGHTHFTVNDAGGRVMLFNPGSISLPRDSAVPTFGILDIENGTINSSVMEWVNKDDFRIRSTAKARYR